MNEEAQMKLQAWVDGELPEAESQAVKQWVESDAEARALAAELRNTNAALVGHEAEVKLPETREFYWSKIQRKIEREDRVEAPARRVSWTGWLWRGLIPTGALALVVGALVLRSGTTEAEPEFTPGMELASDDVGAYTYRSQHNGLTTVWYYNKGQDSQFTKPAEAGNVTP